MNGKSSIYLGVLINSSNKNNKFNKIHFNNNSIITVKYTNHKIHCLVLVSDNGPVFQSEVFKTLM